jgi:hypothetical protein
MFNNTKIDRYELYESIRDQVDSKETFNQIDGFKDAIRNYVYTGIVITDYTEPIEKAFQSRLQILQSETLLRALMLKEGMVLALNNNNFPTYYATLKSFLEIPAVLGYVVHLIYNNNDYNEIVPKINKLHLGNREAGQFPTGNVKAINVMTMFEKLDQVFDDIAREGKSKEKLEQMQKDEKILSSTYADVCNFGHTNFNANLSIGILHDDAWKAKEDSTGYKEELWAFYMTGFSVGMGVIQMFCSMIARNDKVQNFHLMESPKYFTE